MNLRVEEVLIKPVFFSLIGGVLHGFPAALISGWLLSGMFHDSALDISEHSFKEVVLNRQDNLEVLIGSFVITFTSLLFLVFEIRGVMT